MRRIWNDGRPTAGHRLAILSFCGWAGIFALAGCRTATQRPDVGIGTDAAHYDQPATEGIPVAVDDVVAYAWPELPVPKVDAARPWVELTAIWFYYRKAELTDSEAVRIATIVDYAAQHPEADIGINRPADDSGEESTSADLDRKRVATIRDALVQGGVSPDRIFAGTFGDASTSINRLIAIFARDRP